jgi:hypothetical protein
MKTTKSKNAKRVNYAKNAALQMVKDELRTKKNSHKTFRLLLPSQLLPCGTSINARPQLSPKQQRPPKTKADKIRKATCTHGHTEGKGKQKTRYPTARTDMWERGGVPPPTGFHLTIS